MPFHRSLVLFLLMVAGNGYGIDPIYAKAVLKLYDPGTETPRFVGRGLSGMMDIKKNRCEIYIATEGVDRSEAMHTGKLFKILDGDLRNRETWAVSFYRYWFKVELLDNKIGPERSGETLKPGDLVVIKDTRGNYATSGKEFVEMSDTKKDLFQIESWELINRYAGESFRDVLGVAANVLANFIPPMSLEYVSHSCSHNAHVNFRISNALLSDWESNLGTPFSAIGGLFSVVQGDYDYVSLKCKLLDEPKDGDEDMSEFRCEKTLREGTTLSFIRVNTYYGNTAVQVARIACSQPFDEFDGHDRERLDSFEDAPDIILREPGAK